MNQKELRNIFFEIKWPAVIQTASIYVFGVIGLFQLLTGYWRLLTFLWGELFREEKEGTSL